MLKAAGLKTTVFGAKETSHSKLNDNLGVTGDPATKVLREFVEALPGSYYGPHNTVAYAPTTEAVAEVKNCAFADVYHLWREFAGKKNPEDLLSNNINHSNDFGHWIYFQALWALKVP